MSASEHGASPDWGWLSSTQALQLEAYRFDVHALDGEERAAYVRSMVLAATKELGEFLDNVVWKSWATRDQGAILDRDAAVEELVDVAHFVGNLAVLLGCTDAEWTTRYQAKQAVNRERQARPEGYRGVGGT